MSNVPRGWKTDDERQVDIARWPVLARLPDILANPHAAPSTNTKVKSPGGTEYRFDPPQPANLNGKTPDAAKAAVSPQPHVFERRRPVSQRGIPRRESSVLPRSNPFSNPRPRLVDSFAPAVRFLTMVALFTAAGIWVQMAGRHAPVPIRPIETPTTATRPASQPAKNAVDHTVPASSATGPLQTQPEAGARVGRAKDHDFASHNNSATGPAPTAHPMAMPPRCLIIADSRVPRVRVTDSNTAAAAEASAQGDAARSNSADTESDESAAVARFPGFFMDLPTR